MKLSEAKAVLEEAEFSTLMPTGVLGNQYRAMRNGFLEEVIYYDGVCSYWPKDSGEAMKFTDPSSLRKALRRAVGK